MSWVRNPWWDGFWLLSGIPIGIALLLFVPNPHIWAMAMTIMILETGHVVSPMILAWSKPGLRRIVRREWAKHIVLPIAIMGGCLYLPWRLVFGIYFAWNIWHFGMQIFGVTCLYRRPGSNDGHFWRALGCVAFTAFSIGIFPLLGEGPKMHALSLGVFSFNHWLTDIGLSSQASGWRWGFVPLVLAVGVIWLVLRQDPSALPAFLTWMQSVWGLLGTRIFPQILAMRAGIGMIHFVYSARIWKFGDPQVRSAISTDLFRNARSNAAQAASKSHILGVGEIYCR